MKIVTKTLFIASFIAIGLSFSACTKTPIQPTQKPQQVQQKVKDETPSKKPQMTEAQKNKAYKNAMRKVGESIREDMNYQKLDLSTAELKNWFTDITFRVWDHQISREQFVAFGLEKFPQHSYEFNMIAQGLLRN